MASVRVSGDNRRLNAFLSDFGERTLGQVETLFDEAAQDGAADIRRSVETTPSGIVPGKPDRIWTGNMRDSVKGEVEVRKDSIKASWGWLDVSSADAEYIFLQEYGGERVATGMHSLWASFVKQFEKVKRGLKA